MTGKRISAEQVLVMNIFIAVPLHWFDSNAIAKTASIPGSTVRHLLLTFFKLGLLERTETFGGYRYRLSPTAATQPYFRRVQEATVVIQQQ
jgi:DNA-binding IclR family transcriptional regulator